MISEYQKRIEAAKNIINKGTLSELKAHLESLIPAPAKEYERHAQIKKLWRTIRNYTTPDSELKDTKKLMIDFRDEYSKITKALKEKIQEQEEKIAVNEKITALKNLIESIYQELNASLQKDKETIGQNYKGVLEASKQLLINLDAELTSFFAKINAHDYEITNLKTDTQEYKDTCINLVQLQQDTFKRDINWGDYFFNFFIKIKNAITYCFDSLMNRPISKPEPLKKSALTRNYGLFQEKIGKVNFKDLETPSPDATPPIEP